MYIVKEVNLYPITDHGDLQDVGEVVSFRGRPLSNQFC
jgi:hypothetical protein